MLREATRNTDVQTDMDLHINSRTSGLILGELLSLSELLENEDFLHWIQVRIPNILWLEHQTQAGHMIKGLNKYWFTQLSFLFLYLTCVLWELTASLQF